MSSMNSQFENSVPILSNRPLGYSMCEKWSTGIWFERSEKGTSEKLYHFTGAWSDHSAEPHQWNGWKLNRNQKKTTPPPLTHGRKDARMHSNASGRPLLKIQFLRKIDQNSIRNEYQIRNRFSQTTEPVMPGPLTELNLSNYCPVFSPSSTRSK